MLDIVRTFVCLAIVSTSSLAAAQIVDPWPDKDSTPATAPASDQAPASVPASATPPPPATSKPPKPAAPVHPAPTSLSMRRTGEWIEHHAPIMRPIRLREDPPPQQAQVDDEPPPRRYPLELAARPLVLPPGVTELGVSYQRRGITVKQQLNGTTVSKDEGSQTPDLNLSHAFSRAELGIGIGQSAYGWIAIDTQQFPSRLALSAAFSAPQSDGRYVHTQSVSAAHKLCCEENAAVIASAGVHLDEVNVYNDSGNRVAGELISASGGFTLVLQAADRFALTFGGGAALPVVDPDDLDVPIVLSGIAGWLFSAGDSWDIVMRAGFATSSATFLEGGIRKRWGL